MSDPASTPDGPFPPPVSAEGPAALSRLPVGRHGLPREFVAENQRIRILAAALEVFTTRGYAATSVAPIIEAAAVSRHTFYAHFADKEACFLATYEVVVAWLAEQARRAVADLSDWPHATLAGVDALLAFVSADPRLARLCVLEVRHAGRPASGRHRETVGRLAAALGDGRAFAPRDAELPPLLESFLVGGALSLVADRLDADEDDLLTELGPAIAELLLGPYLGPAAVRDLLTTRG